MKMLVVAFTEGHIEMLSCSLRLIVGPEAEASILLKGWLNCLASRVYNVAITLGTFLRQSSKDGNLVSIYDCRGRKCPLEQLAALCQDCPGSCHTANLNEFD